MSGRVERDRVLIVDDAANLRELITLLLETEDDFQVVGTARDGQHALDIAEDLDPHVILLDLAMPVMDGMQALPRLRALVPAATVIVFSGFEEEILSAEAIAAGADAYLEKGSSVTRLVALIRSLRGRTAPVD